MLDERTQLWSGRLLGLAAIGLFGWLTVDQFENPRPRTRTSMADVTPVADAGAPGTAAPATSASGGASARARAEDAGALALVFNESSNSDAGALTDLGTLRAGLPRAVRLGVVLVTYAGAEGAPPGARPRSEALVTAERLAEGAKTEFRRAVSAGDPGSSDDIGRIPRGVLDPATELAVFNLKPGEISALLETPRGYWIVKRHD